MKQANRGVVQKTQSKKRKKAVKGKKCDEVFNFQCNEINVMLVFAQPFLTYNVWTNKKTWFSR